MIQLAIFSILVGAVFGLRFKVMVLIPLTMVGCLMTGFGGIVLGQSLTTVAGFLVASALSLQIGYLFGSITRMTMAALRAPRVSATRASMSNAG